MMRLIGFLKSAAVLFVDYALIRSLTGWEVALTVCGVMALYGWLGEYLALAKDGAVRLEKLKDPERTRLADAREDIIEDVKRVSGIDISALRLSLIPTDELNAYAYGVRNVAVTRALLASCDDATLCAVLGTRSPMCFRRTLCFTGWFLPTLLSFWPRSPWVPSPACLFCGSFSSCCAPLARAGAWAVCCCSGALAKGSKAALPQRSTFCCSSISLQWG